MNGTKKVGLHFTIAKTNLISKPIYINAVGFGAFLKYYDSNKCINIVGYYPLFLHSIS